MAEHVPLCLGDVYHHISDFVYLGSQCRLNATEMEITELWIHWKHIVRYAFMEPKPSETFEMIIKDDEHQHNERIKRFAHDNASDDSIVEVRRSSPLHCVMKLARKYFHGQGICYTLPQVVELLIKAGASVQCLDNDNHCALQTLAHEIRNKTFSLNKINNHKGALEILHTVRVMLAACPHDNWPHQTGLERILESLLPSRCILRVHPMAFGNLTYVNNTAEKFMLLDAMIYVILGKLSGNAPPKEFSRRYKTRWLADVLHAARIVVNCPASNDQWFPSLDSIMHSLDRMFHAILLHGVDDNLYAFSNYHWKMCFLFLVRYYPDPSEPNELMRHLLNGLRASQVIQLKATFLACQKSVTDEVNNDLSALFLSTLDPEEVFEMFTNALEWLNTVPTPRSLQHLAREAVNLAMAHRSRVGAWSLEIPKHLIPYILLETDD